MTDVRRFVQLPLDKYQWSPGPLPGQVVFVTTVDPDGAANIATKSWVSMAAFTGPVVGFGCDAAHQTYRNIVDTGEFVINVPDTTLAATAWDLHNSHGANRLTRSGLTLRLEGTTKPPLIEECRAYLECVHERTVEFGGGELFIFGTVRSVAVDAECLQPDLPDRYRLMDPFFFCESSWYAGLAGVRQV